jgi:hypothetical protein
MQVYQGWNNSDRRFWHYPYAWLSNVHKFHHHLSLVTFSCLLQYSVQAENCGFSQWVDPPTIDPYQQYIDYLEDVVIYNLKQELSEALASPDPSSSVGEDRCCKCSTCTCECHKKIGPLYLHHLHPHWGTTCRRNIPTALCSLGSSRTTRLIRNVAMKILNSLRHLISGY